MKGFLVLAAAVSLTGGLVGGVLSLLLPSAASGCALGVLVALFLTSVRCCLVFSASSLFITVNYTN